MHLKTGGIIGRQFLPIACLNLGDMIRKASGTSFGLLPDSAPNIWISWSAVLHRCFSVPPATTQALCSSMDYHYISGSSADLIGLNIIWMWDF
jgi:hypothetical protein